MNSNAAPFSENPFSTRHIRPGAANHLFAPDVSAAVLLERLKASQTFGQIVGPHGSGKSSLLRAVEVAIEENGDAFFTATLHDGQRAMPEGWQRDANNRDARLIIVDGYEQLSWLNRWRLKRACRKANRGLLVTAHSDVGLPTIIETTTTLEAARAIVAQLVLQNPSPVTDSDIAAAFSANGGNLREMLLSLYDVHERRTRAAE